MSVPSARFWIANPVIQRDTVSGAILKWLAKVRCDMPISPNCCVRRRPLDLATELDCWLGRGRLGRRFLEHWLPRIKTLFLEKKPCWQSVSLGISVAGATELRRRVAPATRIPRNEHRDGALAESTSFAVEHVWNHVRALSVAVLAGVVVRETLKTLIRKRTLANSR